MPRYIFPAGSVSSTGRPQALTFWKNSSTSRDRYVDLMTASGSTSVDPIPNGTIVTDAAGAYPSFAGPEDVTTLWISANGGARSKVTTAIQDNAAPGGAAYASLSDYGGVGDGVTDNTAALAALYSAAKAAQLPMFIPPGKYVFQGPWGITTYPGFAILGAGLQNSILKNVADGQDGIVITPETSGTTAYQQAANRGLRLRDFSCWGNSDTAVSATGRGIVWASQPSGSGVMSGPSMKRIGLSFHGSHGVEYQPATDWLVAEQVRLVSNGGNGWYFNGGSKLITTAVFKACSAGSSGYTAGSAGFKVSGLVTSVHFDTCESGYYDYGFKIDASGGTTVIGSVLVDNCRGENVVVRHFDIGDASLQQTQLVIRGYECLTSPTTGDGDMIRVGNVREAVLSNIFARSMANNTAVIREDGNPHVTYLGGERWANQGTGTLYLRRDSNGVLHKSRAGIRTWATSFETTTVAGNLPMAGSDSNEVLIFDCTAASRTVTLPPVAGTKGNAFRFIKKGAANTMTIAPNGTEKINGANASLSITSYGGGCHIISDGTEWYTVGAILT